MSWKKVPASGGEWSVNIEGASKIIMAYSYMLAFTDQAKTKKLYIYLGGATDDREFGAPLGNVDTVDFDPGKVKSRTQEIYGRNWITFQTKLNEEPDQAFMHLVALRLKTLHMRGERTKLFNGCAKTTKDFESATTMAINACKFARDKGFTVISIYGGAVGGAVGVVAGGMAAIGKGVAKYQDSGRFDQAFVEGFGGLVTMGWGGVAGSVKGLEAAGKGIMFGMGMVLDSAFSITGDALEKKPMGPAFEKAAWKTLQSLGFKGLEGQAEKMIKDAVKREFTKSGVEQGLKTMASIAGEKSIQQPKVSPKLNKGGKTLSRISNAREPGAMMFVTRTAYRKSG
jgi:hypothetical protein